MPCGKRALVKRWDKARNLRVITPSRYEQNEASVKQHWKKVVRDLELSYKDEQFWESQCDYVRDLVGPVIFPRIAKIFNLPLEATQYEPQSEASSLVASTVFYKSMAPAMSQAKRFDSMSDYDLSEELEEEEGSEEESEQWSLSSVQSDELNKRSKSVTKSRPAFVSSRAFSKSFSRFTLSKTMQRDATRSRMISEPALSIDESAHSDDDLEVHAKSRYTTRRRLSKHDRNPHFDMLYCNKSETDMIKWNSNYKQKVFEVSASDEFSKKAEIMTKKIAMDFFDWWVGLGNVEFKSEIKRPEDIEELFQVWFDEHASRGLVMDPKILPCVLQSIADYVSVPKASCPNVLKRQIAYDIHAETSPAHTTAFNTCLPQKIRHIPPRNNTKELWHCVKIPEDLRSMAAVWDDIQHLTSTKAFQGWLKQRPHLPMPPCLKEVAPTDDKKQRFVVPSDFVVKGSSSSSVQDLAIPVSQFSVELKDVLSKLIQ